MRGLDMNKCRIIKRTGVNGSVNYLIEVKHWYGWATTKISHPEFYAEETFVTLEEAQRNLCYYNGTKVKAEVVYNE